MLMMGVDYGAAAPARDQPAIDRVSRERRDIQRKRQASPEQT
jgi:hypothetical protein